MKTIKRYTDSSYTVKQSTTGFYLFHGTTELKSFNDETTALEYADYVYYTGDIPQDDRNYSL